MADRGVVGDNLFGTRESTRGPLNRYPLWRYLLILAVVVLGFLYAAPNLYPPDYALQISPGRQRPSGGCNVPGRRRGGPRGGGRHRGGQRADAPRGAHTRRLQRRPVARPHRARCRPEPDGGGAGVRRSPSILPRPRRPGSSPSAASPWRRGWTSRAAFTSCSRSTSTVRWRSGWGTRPRTSERACGRNGCATCAPARWSMATPSVSPLPTRDSVIARSRSSRKTIPRPTT